MILDPKELAVLVLEHLPQSALVVDSAGAVLLRNRKAAEVLGQARKLSEIFKPAEGTTPAWSDLLAGASSQTSPRGPMRAGLGGATRWSNVCLLAADGRQVTCDVYVRRLPSDAVLIVLDDVSERLSMERSEVSAENLSAAGKLSAKIAHELNNPLDGAMRYIRLAQRSAPEAAGVYMDKALGGLTRMAGVIAELLDRSRPWSHGGEMSQLERILDEALTAMQPRAQALGVNFLTDSVDCQSISVPGAMFQVFCNVIKNAMDAMPDGGLLTVRLRPEGEFCRIEFTDTGRGVAPELAEKIFDPFFTTKPAGEGTGLGLSICREIVTRLGGEISAKSGNGQGMCVTILLPLQGDKKSTKYEARNTKQTTNDNE